MQDHILKTWPDPFHAVWNGAKRAEFRKNDRDFKVGDILVLREYLPGLDRFTGWRIYAAVTHVASGFGIPDGYVMMSIDPKKFCEPTFAEPNTT